MMVAWPPAKERARMRLRSPGPNQASLAQVPRLGLLRNSAIFANPQK